ncbi:hypothetical protein D3C72_2390680 [compost metagenome]
MNSCTGMVLSVDVVLKIDSSTLMNEVMKAKIPPDTSPARICGSVTRKNVDHAEAPRSRDASSCDSCS